MHTIVCQNPSCASSITSSDNRRKFCSRSCSVTVANSVKPKRKAAIYLCSCGTRIGRTAKQCRTCRNQENRQLKIQSWLSGKWSGAKTSDPYQITELIIDYVKTLADWRCQNTTCAYPGGWSEINPTTGRVPVQIDHIDGNASNNAPQNLIVLCPSCHALTPTYGSLNVGNGRPSRRRTGELNSDTLSGIGLQPTTSTN